MQPSADGSRVRLTVAEAPIRLSVSKLIAHDAAGASLPSWFEAGGEVGNAALRLRIDDRGARYPLSIDPLFAVESKLMASDGAADNLFGEAVALGSDTALIGAAWDDDNGDSSGSAYVFVRSGTSWSQQAKLIPDDGAAGDGFGTWLSMDGDAALVSACFMPGREAGIRRTAKNIPRLT